MIINAEISDLSEPFVDSSHYQQPFSPRDLIRYIGRYSRLSGLEEAIKNAHRSIGKELERDAHVDVQFYQIGRFAYIFLAGPKNDGPPMIMQIARGEDTSAAGSVMLQDGENLSWLNQHVGSKYFPEVIHSGDTVGISQYRKIPVLFTEFLEGYHEIVPSKTFGIGGLFRANRLEGEDKEFDVEESKRILREMFRIISYAYAKTYSSESNKGKLIHEVSPPSGDYVYRATNEVEKPYLKLITVRGLNDATPSELLSYFICPIAVAPTHRGYRGEYFSVPGDKKPMETMLEGMEEGLREVYGDEAPAILASWVDSYTSSIVEETKRTLSQISSGDVTSYKEVPVGLRGMFRLFSVREYMEREIERTRTCRALTDQDFDRSFYHLEYSFVAGRLIESFERMEGLLRK